MSDTREKLRQSIQTPEFRALVDDTWRLVVPFQVARTCPLPAAMHVANMAIRTLYKEAEERGLKLGRPEVYWHSPILEEGDFRLSAWAYILNE